MKTIFITGTGSGFGRAAVERFAREGWAVAATVRRAEQANLFGSLPNVRVYVLDVTDLAGVGAVADEVRRDFGRIDAVVNNAGIAHYGPLETTGMDQIRAQFETNYFGLVAVCQAFIPYLRRQGGGTIVNVASLSSKMGFPFFAPYSASKAAVATLSEALSIELAPFDIRVKALFPGTHATKIFTKMDAGLSDESRAYLPYLRNFLAAQSGVAQVSSPEHIAGLIWRAVTDGRDLYEYVGGRDAAFLLILKRLLPQAAWKRLQASSLLRPPTAARLRLLNWVMRGTDELEVRADPRLG